MKNKGNNIATAEIDLNKPSDIIATIRPKNVIIHPERLVKVILNGWTRFLRSYESYINIGNIALPPTQEE